MVRYKQRVEKILMTVQGLITAATANQKFVLTKIQVFVRNNNMLVTELGIHRFAIHHDDAIELSCITLKVDLQVFMSQPIET